MIPLLFINFLQDNAITRNVRNLLIFGEVRKLLRYFTISEPSLLD